MEKILVNYRKGFVEEFNDGVVQISGNCLIITTKKVQSYDDETNHLVMTNKVIDLSEVSNFVKITETKKFEIN